MQILGRSRPPSYTSSRLKPATNLNRDDAVHDLTRQVGSNLDRDDAVECWCCWVQHI